MSIEGFPGRDVRAKLDHPVIDADAHVVECDFAHLDFVREIAGEEIAKTVLCGARPSWTYSSWLLVGIALGPAYWRPRHGAIAALFPLAHRRARHRFRALLHDARPEPHVHSRDEARAACELPRAQHALRRDVRRRRATGCGRRR